MGNFSTFFAFSFISREIRDLRTCDPGTKKFLKFLKKRILGSESVMDPFMAHGGIANIFNNCAFFGNVNSPLCEEFRIFGSPGEILFEFVQTH